MRTHVRFEGGAELAKALSQLSASLSTKVLRDALKEAAEPMRARMSQLAARRPPAPDIADNIGISTATRVGSTAGGRWRARLDGEQAVAVGPTKDFFYGLYLEYGTVKMSAQPFMRPAFDSESQQALDILRRVLWRELAAHGVQRTRTQTVPVTAVGGPTL